MNHETESSQKKKFKWVVNTKKCWVSLAIWEMWIKLRFYLTPG